MKWKSILALTLIALLVSPGLAWAPPRPIMVIVPTHADFPPGACTLVSGGYLCDGGGGRMWMCPTNGGACTYIGRP